MREEEKEGRREECDAPGKCERDNDDDDDDDDQAKIGFSCCSNKANLQFANLWQVEEDLCFAKWLMVPPNF
ncbi:unnamed protein product [Sphagnum jensenii]|jgi:hypothetical protein|uniref:Uncharacterized protein n=1 Tax=Sphagnum jensenii TaxID=128206 RepID=A0ABP0W7S0_9BRYO